MSARPPKEIAPLTADQRGLLLEAEPMIQRTALWVQRRMKCQSADDLVAVGRLAAAGPAVAFDPQRGNRFEDYAYTRVLWAMVEAAAASMPGKLLRELAPRMAVGATSSLPSGSARGDSPGERSQDEVEIHDLIGTGAALGAASGTTADPERALIQKRILRALSRARDKLPVDEQRIIELHWFEGVPLDDLGARLGLGRTTVKARHRRALARLRAFMDAWA
jgi:RNA polymerase sigma factor (sigma-70 family)